MDLDDLRDLNQAAAELGLAPVTLRAQAANGRFLAKKIGSTWITTSQEIERYRREQLGQVGRPALLATIAWPHSYDANHVLRIIGFTSTPPEELRAVIDSAEDAIARGARFARDVRAYIRTDPSTQGIIVTGASEAPPTIGIARQTERPHRAPAPTAVL